MSQALFWASGPSSEQTRRGAGRDCDRGHGGAGRHAWGGGCHMTDEGHLGRALRWDLRAVGKARCQRAGRVYLRGRKGLSGGASLAGGLRADPEKMLFLFLN